jgi:hypothetical protein
VVLNAMTANDGIDNKIWIGNSGASCHYCNNEEEKNGGCNGWKRQQNAVKEGWKLEMHGPKEKWKRIGCRMQRRKTFSISMALKHGFNLNNEDTVMKLMKGNTT